MRQIPNFLFSRPVIQNNPLNKYKCANVAGLFDIKVFSGEGYKDNYNS